MRILTGDCREVLRGLPEESVHCVVTSPPYWGLRCYGVDGQLGQEPTLGEHIEVMVEVFREVRRVLRQDGTVWLNYGDCYAGSWGAQGHRESSTNGQRMSRNQIANHPKRASNTGTIRDAGLKPKDLCMMPARVALALQEPQHYGPIRLERDRAWLAAFIDGEGTISIARNISSKSRGGEKHCQPGYSPFISIGNQDRELLDYCVRITGLGRVALKDRPNIDGRGIRSRRDYYGWRIDATQATEVIRDVFPYLIAKRKQAVLAFNLDLSNKAGRSLRGNGPLPASEQEKREHLKTLVNACNQREPVDLPSWLLEPPSMFEQGWWIRSEIIWAKPNPMPESITDRPTSSHEKIYLLAKSARYFFDAEAVREDAENIGPTTGLFRNQKIGASSARRLDGSRLTSGTGHRTTETGAVPSYGAPEGGRNIRNVWTIATAPFPEAHFATFPPALVEPCIKAGTSEKGCCPECGAPWAREIERESTRSEVIPATAKGALRADGNSHYRPNSTETGGIAGLVETRTTGWGPSCDCFCIEPGGREVPHTPKPATVLDPFGGAGTVGLVADRLGRDAILIELNPEYAAMARERLHADAGMFAEVTA